MNSYLVSKGVAVKNLKLSDYLLDRRARLSDKMRMDIHELIDGPRLIVGRLVGPSFHILMGITREIKQILPSELGVDK